MNKVTSRAAKVNRLTDRSPQTRWSVKPSELTINPFNEPAYITAKRQAYYVVDKVVNLKTGQICDDINLSFGDFFGTYGRRRIAFNHLGEEVM